MSHLDSKAAVDRLAEIRKAQGAEDFAAYAFLVLGILAWNAPDAFAYVIDTADKRLEVQ